LATRLESGRILLDEKELRRFRDSCTIDPITGCWDWSGPTQKDGYGWFSFQLDYEYKQRAAHIVSYNHFVGVVPTGLILAHYNLPGDILDKCAFYEHVRPATRAENAADRSATHRVCKHGHDTAIWGRSSRGNCKVCMRIGNAGTSFRGCLDCGYSSCRCN